MAASPRGSAPIPASLSSCALPPSRCARTQAPATPSSLLPSPFPPTGQPRPAHRPLRCVLSVLGGRSPLGIAADYLRTLTSLSRAGQVHAGQSPLALAAATAEAADVRSAVLAALERDRQMPVSQMHADLLDAYLATSAAVRGGLANASNGHVGGGGRKLGGVTMATGSVGADGALDADERRALLAARASARLGARDAADPSPPQKEPSVPAAGTNTEPPAAQPLAVDVCDTNAATRSDAAPAAVEAAEMDAVP